jgi:hypothetical protein
MYDARTRREALARLESESVSDVARALGIDRSTVRAWRDGPQRVPECPACDEAPLHAAAYAALLGYYLGDGCVSANARYFSLRVSCDARYPGIVDDVRRQMLAVRPAGRVHLVPAPGAVVVSAAWVHWPCLFPQHGPGRKHARPIRLDRWQAGVVTEQPGDFLRGLFHSDGSRVRNWARQVVGGRTKRYDYFRWQFTNESDDIRRLCCWALDLVDVPWRRSDRRTISVSARAAVARLDELIGPKR